MSDDLAKRAVACKGWRWMPGMATTDGERLLFEDRVMGWQAWSLDRRRHTLDSDPLPDLTDAATLGCVLALVREAWEDPYMMTKYWRAPRIWTCKSDEVHPLLGGGRGIPKGKTEAAALVAALEAAP